MAIAILTGHAYVRGHLRIMGLFNGDPSCRFSRMETETVQHIICCCEALAHQRYNFFGKPFVEPIDISTASLRDLSQAGEIGTGEMHWIWVYTLETAKIFSLAFHILSLGPSSLFLSIDAKT
jgi:hypothetical protein